MSYRINFEHDREEVEEKINKRNQQIFPSKKHFILAAVMAFHPEKNSSDFMQSDEGTELLAETNDLLRELNFSVKQILLKKEADGESLQSVTEGNEKSNEVKLEKKWEMPDMSKFNI